VCLEFGKQSEVFGFENGWKTSQIWKTFADHTYCYRHLLEMGEACKVVGDTNVLAIEHLSNSNE